MAMSSRNPPPSEERRDEGSSTHHDAAAPRASESNGAPAPALPPRQMHGQSQPHPQPFYGQPQPMYMYAAPPNQQFAYGSPVRPVPRQSTGYIATRLGLTALSSVWGIIIIALASVLVGSTSEAAYVSWYSYAIAVASILWNSAELITYCARVRSGVQRGIHPGAHVGLNLIFWLIGAFAVLLTVEVYRSIENEVERCSNRNKNVFDTPDWYDYYCDDDTSMDEYQQTIIPVLRALIAVFSFWVLNHLVLFVLACIDTHKRNILKPAAYVLPKLAVPPHPPYYPQAPDGAQQPMQYYPYPVMMQPPPVHVGGVESRAPVSNDKQPAQAQHNFAGFYAPAAPGPAAPGPSAPGPSTPGHSAQAPANNTGAASPVRTI
ncbi:hypothetical protein F4777DRAFT_259145 [Nemania sp. FL0916]|nr:hypothetical protein F4777DRAFT_259145 [Nemania sp. FL0916]